GVGAWAHGSFKWHRARCGCCLRGGDVVVRSHGARGGDCLLIRLQWREGAEDRWSGEDYAGQRGVAADGVGVWRRWEAVCGAAVREANREVYGGGRSVGGDVRDGAQLHGAGVWAGWDGVCLRGG